MTILIAALAAASLLMVIAMVQFSVALVADDAPPVLRRAWGAAYLLSWTAIAAVIVTGAVETHAPWPDTVAVVTLALGGWGGFHAFWIWFWFSIARATATKTGAQGPSTTKLALAHRCGQAAAVAALAVGAAAVELGFARSAAAAVMAPGHELLTLTLGSAVAGFVLFMVATVRLLLDGGEPMPPQEIDEDLRRGKFGGRGRAGVLEWRASAYHQFGPAAGARAEQELSLSAFKDAWRNGAWRRERKWQTLFLMAGGALLMTVGGFSAPVIAGPMPVKLICGGALGYTLYQLVAAMRRA